MFLGSKGGWFLAEGSGKAVGNERSRCGIRGGEGRGDRTDKRV